MNKQTIYYRKSLIDSNELFYASKYFNCFDLISDMETTDFVIPRYSLYPFLYDQIREINNIGAKTINSYEQLLYIADMQNYIVDLKELTPKTWLNIQDIPENGPFVLKGETNSKKQFWNKAMFAKDKKDAIKVYGRLCEDNLIGSQKIYIREYVPLYTYMVGLGEIPITKEFRFFVGYGKVLSGAYYWQNYANDLDKVPSAEEVPKHFLEEVIKRIGNNNNFYVIDVAQTSNGNWIVIELNQGEQSGLSLNDPDVMYGNLKKVFENKIIKQ